MLRSRQLLVTQQQSVRGVGGDSGNMDCSGAKRARQAMLTLPSVPDHVQDLLSRRS